MGRLTLYKLDFSPPARSVMMTLDYLGITDVEMVDVDLISGHHMSEEFIKMNPQHTIPTLKDDDFVIWESHAILTYLVTKYGKDDSLYPKDPKKRALVDQRLHFDSGVLFPALRFAVEPKFYENSTVNESVFPKIRKAYGFLEQFLEKDWLAGDEITLADISCLTTVTQLDIVVPIDTNAHPRLTAWIARCHEKDFIAKMNPKVIKMFATFYNEFVPAVQGQ